MSDERIQKLEERVEKLEVAFRAIPNRYKYPPPTGPFASSPVIASPVSDALKSASEAYHNGYLDGRASRDGLVEAAKTLVVIWTKPSDDPGDMLVAMEALEAALDDGKESR